MVGRPNFVPRRSSPRLFAFGGPLAYRPTYRPTCRPSGGASSGEIADGADGFENGIVSGAVAMLLARSGLKPWPA